MPAAPPPTGKSALPRGAGQAAFWIAVYVALVAAPLAALLLTRVPSGGGLAWEAGIAFGFAGLAMMGVQFLLTARFRRATAPFGIDIIYYFHRYLGYAIVAVVLAHPVLLAWHRPEVFAALDPRRGGWAMTAGGASAALLLALVAVTVWRKRLRIPYEVWRVGHLVLAVAATGLGYAHMAGIAHASRPPAVYALWSVIGLSLVAVVAWVRVVRPWRLRLKPWRVESVAPERGSCWTLTLAPEGHSGFPFEPGQFAWITLRHSPFAMQEHPFSIASAPAEDGTLRFTIKEAGDFTRGIGGVAPGETAYVDGPYGAFSVDRHPDAAGYAFIAGGIGIAPMAGMLRTLADRGDDRPLVLVAAHASLDRAPLVEELERLRERLDLKIATVLEHPQEGWEGESGRIDRDILERSLPPAPERSRWHYFLCGPVPMTRGAERHLRDLGVPLNRVHVELFDMA